jgi:hypothetical protein
MKKKKPAAKKSKTKAGRVSSRAKLKNTASAGASPQQLHDLYQAVLGTSDNGKKLVDKMRKAIIGWDPKQAGSGDDFNQVVRSILGDDTVSMNDVQLEAFNNLLLDVPNASIAPYAESSTIW